MSDKFGGLTGKRREVVEALFASMGEPVPDCVTRIVDLVDGAYVAPYESTSGGFVWITSKGTPRSRRAWHSTNGKSHAVSDGGEAHCFRVAGAGWRDLPTEIGLPDLERIRRARPQPRVGDVAPWWTVPTSSVVECDDGLVMRFDEGGEWLVDHETSTHKRTTAGIWPWIGEDDNCKMCRVLVTDVGYGVDGVTLSGLVASARASLSGEAASSKAATEAATARPRLRPLDVVDESEVPPWTIVWRATGPATGVYGVRYDVRYEPLGGSSTTATRDFDEPRSVWDWMPGARKCVVVAVDVPPTVDTAGVRSTLRDFEATCSAACVPGARVDALVALARGGLVVRRAGERGDSEYLYATEESVWCELVEDKLCLVDSSREPTGEVEVAARATRAEARGAIEAARAANAPTPEYVASVFRGLGGSVPTPVRLADAGPGLYVVYVHDGFAEQWRGTCLVRADGAPRWYEGGGRRVADPTKALSWSGLCWPASSSAALVNDRTDTTLLRCHASRRRLGVPDELVRVYDDPALLAAGLTVQEGASVHHLVTGTYLAVGRADRPIAVVARRLDDGWTALHVLEDERWRTYTPTEYLVDYQGLPAFADGPLWPVSDVAPPDFRGMKTVTEVCLAALRRPAQVAAVTAPRHRPGQDVPWSELQPGCLYDDVGAASAPYVVVIASRVVCCYGWSAGSEVGNNARRIRGNGIFECERKTHPGWRPALSVSETARVVAVDLPDPTTEAGRAAWQAAADAYERTRQGRRLLSEVAERYASRVGGWCAMRGLSAVGLTVQACEAWARGEGQDAPWLPEATLLRDAQGRTTRVTWALGGLDGVVEVRSECGVEVVYAMVLAAAARRLCSATSSQVDAVWSGQRFAGWIFAARSPKSTSSVYRGTARSLSGCLAERLGHATAHLVEPAEGSVRRLAGDRSWVADPTVPYVVGCVGRQEDRDLWRALVASRLLADGVAADVPEHQPTVYEVDVLDVRVGTPTAKQLLGDP